VPFKDRTVSCDYVSTAAHGHTLYVVVTFGSTESDLETAVKVLPAGGKTAKVSISGAAAYRVTDKDGTDQLFAQSGTRLVSVVGDSALSRGGAIAVAELFLGT
jgi:chitinase